MKSWWFWPLVGVGPFVRWLIMGALGVLLVVAIDVGTRLTMLFVLVAPALLGLAVLGEVVAWVRRRATR